MGLYDSYRQSNTSAVRQFPGSIVPDLMSAKKEADNLYLDIQKTSASLAPIIASTPTATEKDRTTLMGLHKEALDLARNVDVNNLGHAVTNVQNVSGKVAAQTSFIARQAKNKEEVIKTLDSKELELPEATKQKYREEAENNYTGAQFDASGMPISAEYKLASTPVRHVSNMEMLNKAAAGLTGNSDARVVDSYQTTDNGLMYKVQTGSSIRELSANDLLTRMNSTLELEPGWKESLNQDVETKLYHATKGLNEDIALQQVMANPNSKAYEYYSKNGYSAKAAIEKEVRDQATAEQRSALEEYVKGFANTHTSNTTQKDLINPTGNGNDSTTDGKKEASNTPSQVVGTTTGLPVNDLNNNIEVLKQTYATQNSTLKTKQANLEAATKAGADPTTKLQLSNEIEELKTQSAQTKFFIDRNNAQLQQNKQRIAAENGKSWTKVEKENATHITKVAMDYMSLAKVAVGTKQSSSGVARELTGLPKEEQEQVAKAIAENKVYTGTTKTTKNIFGIDKENYVIPSSNFFNTVDTDKQKYVVIKDETGADKKVQVDTLLPLLESAQTEEYKAINEKAASSVAQGLQSTLVSFGTEDDMVKIGQQASKVEWTDMSGIRVDDKVKETLLTQDMKIKGYIPELDKIEVSVKDAGTYLLDVKGVSGVEGLADKLLTDNRTGKAGELNRMTGRLIKTGQLPDYAQAVLNSPDIIYSNPMDPAGKAFTKQDGEGRYQVAFVRGLDGTYTINKLTGIKPGSSKDKLTYTGLTPINKDKLTLIEAINAMMASDAKEL